MLTSSLVRHAARRTAGLAVGAVRNLNVHEYVSMEIMNKYHIATPKGYVASTPQEAESICAQHLQQAGKPYKDCVIKAQVLSGGRGLGRFKNGFQGGVHMVTKPGQALEFAEKMLGQELVTKQAPNGILCSKVFLMERVFARREMYLSILMDRASQGPLMVGSPYGGTSIEQVAASSPEFIFIQPIDIVEGLTEEQCNQMAINLGLEEDSPLFEKTVNLMKNLYDMFISCDCTQVEVNPLAETPEGDVVVCDAKVNFDDNAEYRQSAIFARRDYTQEDPREVVASKYGLRYIRLDGSIACMVNGAGLTMATMDIINRLGGSPANFLDVGGRANQHQVQKAFEILNDDSHVKVILVNIFGGIVRCDVVANGIINAAKEIGIQKPILIRLQGTKVDEAKSLIKTCGVSMLLADEFEDAATKAVSAAKIAMQAEQLNADDVFEILASTGPTGSRESDTI